MIRSFLFTPADDERKVEKALASQADAVILDLEDSVAPANRPAARRIAARHAKAREQVWIRINPLDSEDADVDLEEVVGGGPAGIVLPKPESAGDAIDLAVRLDELEAEHDLPAGAIRILPICTERPEALFALGGYRDATPRLAGLAWGAEDLSTAVGARTARAPDGAWLPPYELARSLCLFGAAAAGVAAIDTVYTDFRDARGLGEYAARARRDGFTGMFAIHPAQVAVINDAFRPTPEEIDTARKIVELFDANPGAGTLGLDGRMLDRPHLEQARRLLDVAGRVGSTEE